jgi:hypothetical protein
MELEDLQRIWDSQNNRPLYVIDDHAMNKQIRMRKDRAHHITNRSELLLIAVNIGAGCLLIGLNFAKPGRNLFIDLTAAWMFGTALYVLANRARRIKGDNRFDRSVRGDLDHALSMATYQVRLSRLMRLNVLPMAALILLGMGEARKSLWLAGAVLGMFALSWFAGGFEHRYYRARQRELESLHKKLGPYLQEEQG